MSTIQGVTGPDRQVELTLDDIVELTIQFNRNLVQVIRSDGSIGHYDLAQVSTIDASYKNDEFTIEVKRREAVKEAKKKEEDKEFKPATSTKK